MTQTKKDGKPFNPSLGGAFSNTAFGDGSVLLNITSENFPVIMKNLQIGSSILFRYNKVTSKGNNHYFAEILPPSPGYKVNHPPVGKAVGGDLD